LEFRRVLFRSHALVDDLDVLVRIYPGALQRLVQEVVCGRAARGRNLFPLQILDARDALIGMHPDLPGRVLEIVDQEHLALATRGKVGEHAAGREHVEASADERLEELDAGRKLARLDIQPRLLPGAEVLREPQLRVYRKHHEIADAHLRALLREKRTGGAHGERSGAGQECTTGRVLQVHGDFLLLQGYVVWVTRS